MKKLTKILALALILMLAMSALVVAHADYPEKGITVICPWAAGGGTDSILRSLSEAVSKELGVNLTVENKTGGAGAIGHADIMNAKPDGYTVGMITFELNSLPPQGLIDFTYADFDPLIRVNTDAVALTVKADAPYNTIAEFVEYAKANPNSINIGNSAPGSVWHIGAGLLANATGIEVKHVPFEGAAPAVTALAGGHIEAVTVSVAEVRSQVEAGNLKILGVMDTERSPIFPEVPTFQEEGFDLLFYTWRGMALPKGVDPAVREKLIDAFTKAMSDPTFVEFAGNMGLNLAYQDATEFGTFLKENYDVVVKTMEETHLLDE